VCVCSLQPRLFGCTACVPWARVRTRQQHQPLCPIFKRSLFETNFPRRRQHRTPFPSQVQVARIAPKPLTHTTHSTHTTQPPLATLFARRQWF